MKSNWEFRPVFVTAVLLKLTENANLLQFRHVRAGLSAHQVTVLTRMMQALSVYLTAIVKMPTLNVLLSCLPVPVQDAHILQNVLTAELKYLTALADTASENVLLMMIAMQAWRASVPDTAVKKIAALLQTVRPDIHALQAVNAEEFRAVRSSNDNFLI